MDITKLSRGELQKLAKVHNIRGTLKTTELVKELDLIINISADRSNTVDFQNKENFLVCGKKPTDSMEILEFSEPTAGWRYSLLFLCILGSSLFVSSFYLSGLFSLWSHRDGKFDLHQKSLMERGKMILVPPQSRNWLWRMHDLSLQLFYEIPGLIVVTLYHIIKIF